jgi:hypothetical protein
LLRESRLATDPRVSIPGELHGNWESGIHALDLRSDPLIRDWYGAIRTDLGRVVEILPDPGRRDAYIVSIQADCGLGVYRLDTHTGRQDLGITFTLRADPCPEREDILTVREWYLSPPDEPRLGPFTAGRTYTSGTFTEPFRFVMPKVDDEGPNKNLARQFALAHRYVSDGGISFGGYGWSMVILDDLPIHADVCDPTSALLADIPATPGAVGDWLRSSPGLSVSDPVEVPVDGRTALRFDLGDGASPCHGARLPAGGNFEPYLMRAYAIPTGDDTILLVTGSDDSNYEAVKAAVEALVRSMDFE